MFYRGAYQCVKCITHAHISTNAHIKNTFIVGLTANHFCDCVHFPEFTKKNWTVIHNGEDPDQFQLVLVSMKDTLYDSSGVKATISFVNGAAAFQWQLRAHSQPRSFRLHVCKA